ncbi:MAG TPA: FAD-dependent oxidoreductase [Gemmatimonadales bacterium]|nr:FAD-dependent oxidoreductase [Gemmatimonadales bacterium]
MERDLARLSDTVHDVIVVGGGIHGACIAWDAALRGLRVALLERDDFGGATSANSLRIVHGGLRYLARGDWRRMRESVRERSALLRIAPTLVEPLPVLVPTSGAGTQSRLALGSGIALNDLLTLDRNRGLDADHRLARGRLLSLADCRRRFPAFPTAEATGGALWYDARLRHPERLTLAFVRSAMARGAVAANHCRFEEVLVSNGEVRGVKATDTLSGETVEARGRTVMVAAGPWTGALAEPGRRAGPQAFALNLVIDRSLGNAAVGARAHSGVDRDPIIGGHRFIFLVPQGETTLLGTWYALDDGREPGQLIAEGTAALLGEFQTAFPALALDQTDVLRCQWGRLPLRGGREPGRADALADRPVLTDHGASGGIRGMYSVEGVKFTTARHVAERAVDRIVTALGEAVDRCRTAETRVDAGEGQEGARVGGQSVLHAVRAEMAVTLSDVVFRRIGSGAPPEPAAETVAEAAGIAAEELGWTTARRDAEIEDVMRQLKPGGSFSRPLA